jgi:hypothetical protein
MDIFVGYDAREHACFQVLEYNLSQWGHTVHPIKHRELRDQGKFNREWFTEADGQWIDRRDMKPFSTEFSHTRFAAIPLAREMGIREWCMFVDVDFLFLDDPADMFRDVAESHHALACVQHNWAEPEGKKMDGMLQLLYDRKLWSSLFLFDPRHPLHDWMTYHRVNWATGAEMHAFSWIEDRFIAKLPSRWNHIPNFSDPDEEASAIHWSYGGPWMPGFEEAPYADIWRQAYHSTLMHMVENRVALDPDKVSHGRIVGRRLGMFEGGFPEAMRRG